MSLEPYGRFWRFDRRAWAPERIIKVLTTLSDIEGSIQALVQPASMHPKILASLEGDDLRVLKYTPTQYLESTLKGQKLYASSTPGHTWGDAVYVAPISCPRTTMMYGCAGIVGTRKIGSGVTFFDATDPKAIDLYQQWISYVRPLFLQLTTTVHANDANQKLRNSFRTRFRIDCVIFPPDELCAHYVDPDDVWLALTHWGATGEVAHGAAAIVQNLRWCVIGTDAFETEGLGYRAFIHPVQSSGKVFTRSRYTNLPTDILSAYKATNQVIITEF